MKQDICQNDVSLKTAGALEDWNRMILAFLAHGTETPTRLAAVLESEPGFAMGHAARGLFSLLMGRRELVETARSAQAAAHIALATDDATRRERGWCAALDGWLAGRPSAAVAAMEEILTLAPHDTLSMKLSHAIRFVLGDGPGMLWSVERVLDAHGEDHPCRGYALGCHAFALEESGAYAAAERRGLEGLVRAPDDAWGLHAVAHVYDMTCNPDRGIALLEQNDGAWLHCNNFRYHVWWHKALLHLDQGQTDRVLALYDQKIRVDRTDDYRDIANATSLLVRLELEGVDVGGRWGELADLAETRSNDGCLVFADLHYMMALTGDHRDSAARKLMTRMRRDAGPQTEVSRIVADPGLAAAQGLEAFGEGRYDEAFGYLSYARVRLQNVGGSHAQRDVFERITVDAGLRAGRLNQVEGILLERRARRAGADDQFALSRFSSIRDARNSTIPIAAQ